MTVLSALLLYAGSLAALLVFAFIRCTPGERSRIPYVAVSLIGLFLVMGPLRAALTGTAMEGAILLGVALNIGITVGTGFDPLNSAVNWPDDDSETRDAYKLRQNPFRSERETVERVKRAWPALLLTSLLAVAIFAWQPVWLFGE